YFRHVVLSVAILYQLVCLVQAYRTDELNRGERCGSFYFLLQPVSTKPYCCAQGIYIQVRVIQMCQHVIHALLYYLIFINCRGGFARFIIYKAFNPTRHIITKKLLAE